MNLETHNIYRLMYPLMWLLAMWAAVKKAVAYVFGFSVRTNSLFFDGLGPTCRQIKEGAKSWKALHILYNYAFKKPRSLSQLVDNFWLMSPNAQAVRNRNKIVADEMHKTIRDIYLVKCDEVRIMSLAAGSAEGVLEAVLHARMQGIPMRCLLIDVDPTAMEYARRVAEAKGISHLVETQVASVTNIPKIRKFSADFRPDIVEMIGLLDYLHDQKAVSLFRTIRESLPSFGKFYTCNILPNPERFFLEQVIDWKMVYRTRNELRQLLLDAGFEEARVHTVVEPLQIHAIVIGEIAQPSHTTPTPKRTKVQEPFVTERELHVSAPGMLQ